jgi:hypothetical protein
MLVPSQQRGKQKVYILRLKLMCDITFLSIGAPPGRGGGGWGGGGGGVGVGGGGGGAWGGGGAGAAL